MKRTVLWLVPLLAVTAALGGCGRGNGLPGDLVGHLASKGVTVQASREHAPVSRRNGYLALPFDEQTHQGIVSSLQLQAISTDDPRLKRAVSDASGIPAIKDAWGIVGRPAQLKLANGGQLEYLYLIVTTDGWLYLLAEYAYG